ncbi:OmpA family protein [Sulfurimonas sp.]|nr:OmpA family protein [Sulfurimonas sp.]
MKRLLLIPAFLGTMAIAQEYKYEITPVIGYNIAEGNLNLENQSLIGVELQYNDVDSFLKPELSLLHTDADYENSPLSTDINRIAINGVHEYDTIGSLIPLTKVGVGYETMNRHLFENKESIFFDVGVGAKVPLTDAIALKLEAVYMLKNNDNRWDNNLAMLAGINFSFGKKAQAPAPVETAVDGDDDNDGVLNSLDQCPTTPAGTTVDASGCKVVDGDDDQDSVLNSIDECPTTPLGHVVNSKGCELIVNLNVNFENNSYEVDDASLVRIQKFAKFLVDFPNYNAQIVGHTNNIGRESSNQRLSENRASAVKDLIVKEGVEASRVSSAGKGESSPITTNDTPEGLAENRRIEATLTKN